jgi:hypothetical protein
VRNDRAGEITQRSGERRHEDHRNLYHKPRVVLAAEQELLVQLFSANQVPTSRAKGAQEMGHLKLIFSCRGGATVLLRIEFDFHQLFSFVRRRFELPVAHGSDRTLREDRMAALHVYGLHGAIGRDADFELDHAPDVHGLGEGWVGCRSLHDDFPASIDGFLGPGLSQSEDESDRNEEGDVALPHRGFHIKQI